MKHSPCKDCEDFPCNKHKHCVKRQEYADSYRGSDLMKAVDCDTEYRLMPM